MTSTLAMAAVVAALAAGGFGYFKGHRAGKDQCEATIAREERVAKVAGDAAAGAAAVAIARISVRHTTIRQEAEREIQVRTEYRDCRHSVEQLQRINSALNGDTAGSAPGDGKLP